MEKSKISKGRFFFFPARHGAGRGERREVKNDMPKKKISLGRSILQNRLKRVFPKFHANRNHPRGVNGLSKFSIFSKICPPKIFSARKINFAKLSETRFPKFSRQSEPSSRVKRPLKIFDVFEKCTPKFFFASEDHFCKIV